jgi:hypothetical protein
MFVGTVGEMIANLRAQVPSQERDKLPTDLARNIDHYLDGAKKIVGEDGLCCQLAAYC